MPLDITSRSLGADRGATVESGKGNVVESRITHLVGSCMAVISFTVQGATPQPER